MSKQDTHFFNVFSVVLGLLVVFMLMMFAFARHVGQRTSTRSCRTDPLVQQGVEAAHRHPGTGRRGRVRTTVRWSSHQSWRRRLPVPALAIPKDGTEVYEAACKACHGLGIAGAPKAGDAAPGRRASRRARRRSTSTRSRASPAQAGVMPAKGGRTDLSGRTDPGRRRPHGRALTTRYGVAVPAASPPRGNWSSPLVLKRTELRPLPESLPLIW